MAKKKSTPPKNATANRDTAAITNKAIKKAAPKGAVKRGAATPAGVDCVDAPAAQRAVDGCMARFGVGGLSKATRIGDALPGRINAFCSCVRTSSGVTQASCGGSMTFQQVEVALVCP
jgi:hypothetical protein